jgi:hypothetical protein
MELLLPLREREPPLPLLCRDGERDGERGRPLKLPFRESFSRDGLRLNDPLDFSRLRLRWLLPCLDNFPPLSLDGLRLLFWRESEPPLPLLPCRLKDRLPLSWDGLRLKEPLDFSRLRLRWLLPCLDRDGLRLNDPRDFSRLRLRWLLPCLDSFPPLSWEGLRVLFWRESEPPLSRQKRGKWR